MVIIASSFWYIDTTDNVTFFRNNFGLVNTARMSEIVEFPVPKRVYKSEYLKPFETNNNRVE